MPPSPTAAMPPPPTKAAAIAMPPPPTAAMPPPPPTAAAMPPPPTAAAMPSPPTAAAIAMPPPPPTAAAIAMPPPPPTAAAMPPPPTAAAAAAAAATAAATAATAPRVLCIGIDQFNESVEDIKKTILDIGRNYDANSLTNIDLVLVNTIKARDTIGAHNATAQTKYVGNIIGTISKKLKSINFDPKKYMVCNYVKFKNQTVNLGNTEKTLKTQMPVDIIAALKEHRYEQCYYEWLGYSNTLFMDYITNDIGKIHTDFTSINTTTHKTFLDINRIPIRDEEILVGRPAGRERGKGVPVVCNESYMFYNYYLSRLHQRQFGAYFPIKPPQVDPECFGIDIRTIKPATNDFVYSLGELIEGIQTHIKNI